jgi:HlyD family secretion protein
MWCRPGTVLATLDPTFAAADAAQLGARLASRGAQVARLEAEVDGREYRASADAPADQRLQEATFLQREAWRRARLRDLDERSARAEAGLVTSRRDMEALGPRLDVLRELEAMRGQLLATQTGSRVSLLEARNQRLELEARGDHLRLALVELRHELESTRAERQSFLEDQRQLALEELARLRSERDAIAEELAKAALRQRMVVLTAPADAVVLQVADRSVGSVLREAEPLVTLVPLGVALEAELAVEARDIGRVTPGQPVRIKLDAWPYQEHGTLAGSLRVISEGAFAREGERPPASSTAPVPSSRTPRCATCPPASAWCRA